MSGLRYRPLAFCAASAQRSFIHFQSGRASLHEPQMRHRRSAQCGQVHAVQRADAGRRYAADNYPFCTIEPNVGDVEVPTRDLRNCRKSPAPRECFRRRLTFVDIAGLVRGASKGEGLGNQFLATIRKPTRSLTWCAVSTTKMSPTSGGASIPCLTSRLSTRNWCWPTSPRWKQRNLAIDKKARGR